MDLKKILKIVKIVVLILFGNVRKGTGTHET